MQRHLPASLLSILLFGGCATTTSSTKGADPQLETRVAWTTKCPHVTVDRDKALTAKAGVLGLLVAAIAPKLIEGAVDSAAEALKAAGQAKTLASSAKTMADFYGVSPSGDLSVLGNCLVLVKGTFGPEGTAGPFGWANNLDELQGLQKISFLLESEVRPLRGLKHFQLAPRYLEVNEFEESSHTGRSDRDYVVAVSMTVPGGAQPFGSAEMSFKDIPRTVIQDPDDWRLRQAVSLPIAFPQESADATRAKAKREGQLAPYLLAADILTPPDAVTPPIPSQYSVTQVGEAAKALCSQIQTLNGTQPRQFQIHDDRCSFEVEPKRAKLDVEMASAHRSADRIKWANGICPNPIRDSKTPTKVIGCNDAPSAAWLGSEKFTYVTTQVTLSETREGSKFAAFLGNALSAAKADVSTVLKDKLLPKTLAQKDAEADEDRSTRNAVLLADLEVSKAEEGLAAALMVDPIKPVDVAAARIALLKAKIDANKAYRKAGLPVRFSELD